jgi:hypothetical protein
MKQWCEEALAKKGIDAHAFIRQPMVDIYL